MPTRIVEHGLSRVLLALAFPVERAALRAILEQHPSDIVVGESSGAATALQLALDTQPDLIVIDDCLPDMECIVLAHFLSRGRPQADILLCCQIADEQFIADGIREGVRGFVSEGRLAENIIAALDALSDNRPYWDEVVSEESFVALMGTRPVEPIDLTEREKEGLRLVAKGYRTPEIAKLLHIEKKTVDSHRLNPRRKLKLQTLSDVVRYAIDRGCIRA
jgi:DNA-binding NarL/FixJ family response regulator